MKVILGRLQISVDSLSRLANEPKLSVKQKYELSRFITTVDKELKHGDKVKDQILAQFDQEKGKDWRDNKEHVQQFINDYNDLLQQEVEFGFDKFSISNLPEETTLTAADFNKLDWFLEE